MRRGSFFASELNPVSILFFSIFALGLDGQTTVLLHTPEMNSDKQERNERENHDMKHIKPEQSVFSDDVSAEENKTHFVANQGHRGNDVRADRDRPKRKLIPRQEIACVAEEQRKQKKKDADDPIEFVGRFVAPAVEHVKHVPEDGEDH